MAKNIWEVFDANPGGASGKQVTDAQGNVTTNPTMIGHKAVSAALAQGFSVNEIEKALASDLGQSRTAESNKGGKGLSADLQIKGPTNIWGVHSEKKDDKGNVTKTAEEGRKEFVGTADVNFMRDQGMGWTEIKDYMGDKVNLPGLVSDGNLNTTLWNTIGDVGSGAADEKLQATVNPIQNKLTETTTKVGELNTAYTDLSGQYSTLLNKYDALGKSYTGLKSDVAQAAKDAMKIKYTGSTAVQNPSAMGIQAAQGTPFKGSGLAGTAALARPNKGLKIKTLNV